MQLLVQIRETIESALGKFFDERVKSLTESIVGKETEIGRLTARVLELEGVATAAASAHKTALEAKALQITAQAEEISAKDKLITDLQAQVKTVGEAAAEITAAQGIPATELPATAAGASAATQLDQVRAQMAKEQDPEKLAVLNRKARELRGDGDMFTPKKR
jgi:CheY-like chemotaxis protein